MATEKERKALDKQKRDAAAAKVRAENDKIVAKQKAKKGAKLAKGKKTLAGVSAAVGNTAGKRAKEAADREIAYNKSVTKVKNINKKAGRTTKNDPKTSAETTKSQLAGLPGMTLDEKKVKPKVDKTTEVEPKVVKNARKTPKKRNVKSVSSIKSQGSTKSKKELMALAKKEKRSRTITGDILIGNRKSGKKTTGAIKTAKEKQGRISNKDGDSYKQGDKRSTYDAISKEELANMTPQQRRIAKRTNKRLDRKESRKNERAKNVAIRKGMSPQQAKDFMQNRRNRLNQAMGEFGRAAATGGTMDYSKLDKRMYRKNPQGSKGPGTLQATSDGKGGTYDATAPYQGVGASRTGRGLNRRTSYYDKFTKVKPLELDPTIKSKNPQNDTENKNKTAQATENTLKGNQGNDKSTKLYGDMPPEQRPAASAYNQERYGTDNPTAEGKADNTFTYTPGNRQEALNAYNKRVKKASGTSPVMKLDDRSSMQGNMMNAKGRR